MEKYKTESGRVVAESIKPLQDKIIVKPAVAEDQTRGGILIPEIAQEETQYGVVVAVGPGKVTDRGNLVKMSVKVGDQVYFTKNATIDVTHNGSHHLMMKEERVLVIKSKKKLKKAN